VTEAPTRFGPVSYIIEASARAVRVHLDVPRARSLLLRLRLPGGRHIVSMTPRRPFDREMGTINLSGASGSLDFLVRTT
jgi:hypothetical protein